MLDSEAEGEIRRGVVSQNLVSEWGQWRANHKSAINEACKDKSSLVGGNSDVTNHILVRDVGLDATGKLDNITIKLASNLKIPHHQGAGGEDDFVNKEAFQRQMKRNKNKKKR
jgi:hypothetical protein